DQCEACVLSFFERKWQEDEGARPWSGRLASARSDRRVPGSRHTREEGKARANTGNGANNFIQGRGRGRRESDSGLRGWGTSRRLDAKSCTGPPDPTGRSKDR